MLIEQVDDQKFMVFGSVKVLVPPTIYDIIEAVKKLTYDEQFQILTAEGLEISHGVDEKIVLNTALSFVQNGWFMTATGMISEHVKQGHEGRLAKYQKALEKAKATPPPAEKQPKAPRTIKIPKDGTTFKPVASTARIAGRSYTINPDGDVAITAGFTGFRKAIYETLFLAGAAARLTFDQVLEQTKTRGIVFKGADGGKNQTAYQLKELVGMNIALLLPQQAEIPADGPTFPHSELPTE